MSLGVGVEYQIIISPTDSGEIRGVDLDYQPFFPWPPGKILEKIVLGSQSGAWTVFFEAGASRKCCLGHQTIGFLLRAPSTNGPSALFFMQRTYSL